MNTNISHTGPGRLSLSPGQNAAQKPHSRLDENGEEFKAIIDAVRSTQFGEVTVIVQDGFIVQINRLEKRRLR